MAGRATREGDLHAGFTFGYARGNGRGRHTRRPDHHLRRCGRHIKCPDHHTRCGGRHTRRRPRPSKHEIPPLVWCWQRLVWHSLARFAAPTSTVQRTPFCLHDGTTDAALPSRRYEGRHSQPEKWRPSYRRRIEGRRLHADVRLPLNTIRLRADVDDRGSPQSMHREQNRQISNENAMVNQVKTTIGTGCLL